MLLHVFLELPQFLKTKPSLKLYIQFEISAIIVANQWQKKSLAMGLAGLFEPNPEVARGAQGNLNGISCSMYFNNLLNFASSMYVQYI